MIKIIIGVVAIIFILGLIGASGDTTETKQENSVQESSQQENLAERVQEAYLSNIGYESISELNLDADYLVGKPTSSIVKFTEENKGQVQVTVQEELTKQEATRIAKDVAFSASDVEGLKSIFVVGTNGVHASASN